MPRWAIASSGNPSSTVTTTVMTNALSADAGRINNVDFTNRASVVAELGRHGPCFPRRPTMDYSLVYWSDCAAVCVVPSRRVSARRVPPNFTGAASAEDRDHFLLERAFRRWCRAQRFRIR